MATKNLGAVTAYAYAKAGGYTGTEEEFQTLMAALPDSVEDAQEAVSTVTGLTAQATKVVSTAPARATYNKIANRIDFEIPEGNGIASVALTSTSGAVKTYTITFDDGTTTTFDVTDGEVTQEVFEEAITELDEKKANYDGYYDEMTVGTAEQLISSATIEDDELYVFRNAGGTNDIGNRETDMLVGGTVAWNQLLKEINDTNWIAESGTTASFNNGEAVFTATVNDNGIRVRSLAEQPAKLHKHLFMCDIKGASECTAIMVLGSSSGTARELAVTTEYTHQDKMFTTGATISGKEFYIIGRNTRGSLNVEISVKNVVLFDLTAMFGTEIADYIYSLEQANAGDGVAWFRKYFPKPYYAYNAGSLQSVNVASHDLTGFNQWDEEWELGYYDAANGRKTNVTSEIRGKNLISVIPNTAYYGVGLLATSSIVYFDANKRYVGWGRPSGKFTTPNNVYYLGLNMGGQYGTTYKGDICINRVWTGYRNGEYEEYVKHSYPYDESVELRGIPQLVDGELKYDGDTYESSGKVTRKYGIVDLGTLTWSYSGSGDAMYFWASISDKRVIDSTDVPCHLVCDKFSVIPVVGSSGTMTNKSIMEGRNENPLVLVKDLSCETVAQFTTSVSGTYLLYELATPTEEEVTGFTNPQICDDFGTEEYVDAGVKSGTRDVAIPVGHVTQYMANLRDKLQHLPSLASSDGDYIIGQSGTSMSLKPIAPYFNAEHPNLTAGSANQLLSTITIEDQTPYTFRTSGGSVDIGDRETDMIVGGTIAWNQLVDYDNAVSSVTVVGVTYTKTSNGHFTANGTSTGETAFFISATGGNQGNVSYVKDHVYLLQGCPSDGAYNKYYLSWSLAGDDNGNGNIRRASDDVANGYVYFRVRTGVEITNKVITPQLFDLTQMFGSTIADYIYSLEQANAGAGVSFFRSLFPKPYYEYNAGELLSVSGLQSHDTVGFNQWDEEWEVYGSGSTARIGSKNNIPCIGGQTYYINSTPAYGWKFYDADGNVLKTYYNKQTDAPANAKYMTFQLDDTYGTTYKNDICINLSWDGERDGEYEPYTINSYALDSSLTLRGIPKLDASNNLYYDGDTYEADGTVTRKYGVVDLGTLSWSLYSNAFYANIAGKAYTNTNADIICAKYAVYPTNQTNADGASATLSDKQMCGFRRASGTSTNSYVYIKDSSYASASDLKTSLSGVYLIYELATPTTESAEPYTNPQIVDDFGTEEYVTDSIVPVGHVTQYQPNLRAKLEMAPNSPDGDGDYIVRQTNGINEYVELVIPNELPDMPTADGSYTLGVTVSNGAATLSWVSNT